MEPVHLSPANGSLQLHTGVGGRAARMGHALVIAMDDWSASIDFNGQTPTMVQVTVNVAHLTILEGHGGLTPISPVDRKQIERNTLSSLQAGRYPKVTFKASDLTTASDGYDLKGRLSIAGITKGLRAHVSVTEGPESWQVRSTVTVSQTDFGIEPYSTMLGALRVRNEVSVDFAATIDKPAGPTN